MQNSEFIANLAALVGAPAFGAMVADDTTRGVALAVQDGLSHKPVALATVAPMTMPDRDQWLVRTASELAVGAVAKYRAGQVEHKCDLGHVGIMGLLDEMEKEATDQLMYVREIKRRLM